MNSDSRIIVALDFPNVNSAMNLVSRLHPKRCKLKVGKEMFTHAGPAFVRDLTKSGFDVFLDLKFHDIPNTVARACDVAADLGIWMLNVHTLGGRKMMMAARESIEKKSTRPLLIGVTILTSMGQDDIQEVGIANDMSDEVQRLAKLALDSGLDGVVCSPHETGKIRSVTSDKFILVTPGIRLSDGATQDQKRVSTPASALSGGASYLVIGRPITQAPDPMNVIHQIEAEIASI